MKIRIKALNGASRGSSPRQGLVNFNKGGHPHKQRKPKGGENQTRIPDEKPIAS